MATLFPDNPVSLLTSFDNAESTYTFGEDVTFQEAGDTLAVRFWGSLNPITTSPQAAIYLTSGGAPERQQAFAGYPAGFQTSAWNTVTLSSPYPVGAGAVRRVCVGPLNRYAAGNGVFPRTVAPLSGSAGYFVANPALTFPNSAPQTTWYAVDLLFQPAAGGPARWISATRRQANARGRQLPVLLRTAQPLTVTGLPVRYHIDGPYPKWTITMALERVSVLSRQLLPFNVTAYVAGRPYDPRSASFSVALLAGSRSEPAPADWKAGDWDVNLIQTYVGRVMIGPGSAAVLAKGRYYPWVRIVDATSGEEIVKQVGKLIIY